MSEGVIVEVAGEALTLLAQRSIYWKAHQTLILSDLHLGKAGHFRKHGIPVSKKVHLADLQILHSLILQYQPASVWLLGDLFHSDLNNEWTDFIAFLDFHKNVRFTLVEGNHDILANYPKQLIVTDELIESPFSFTHIRKESSLYNISGHIHPGITIRGKARQSVTMPCFYISIDHAILPAFGQFTGIKKINPQKADRVFGIADQTIIELTR